jgi:hypothetical protein
MSKLPPITDLMMDHMTDAQLHRLWRKALEADDFENWRKLSRELDNRSEARWMERRFGRKPGN